MSAAQLQPGMVLSQTYEIVRLLGEGGMGAVYEARHLRLSGRRVAVKVLLRDLAQNQEVFARFRREAEIGARIGHPSIINVTDWDALPDGSPFLVMEFLDGEDLHKRMAKGPLPPDHIARVLSETGSALSAAHKHGIVHRDLKPANIFLMPVDERGGPGFRVKVLDFGISKIAASQTVVTRESAVLGTPQYMAPEQALGKSSEIDARTDQFALATIAYELYAGRPAFSADTITAVLFKVVYEEPPPLAQVAPSVPAHIAAAIARGMHKQRDARFADVGAFLDALLGAPPAQLSSSHAQPAQAAHGAQPSGWPQPTPAPSSWPAPQPASTYPASPPVPQPTPASPWGASPAPTPAPEWSRGPAPPYAHIPSPASNPVGGIPHSPMPPVAPGPVTATGGGAGKVGLIAGAVALLVIAGVLYGVTKVLRRAGQAANADTPSATVEKRPRKRPPLNNENNDNKPATNNDNDGDTAIDPSNFDVTGFIPRATAIARDTYEDALLVRIDVKGVRPDGTADLKLANGDALYRFQSPSRSQRPANLPLGAKWEPQCIYYVSVNSSGQLSAHTVNGWSCDYPLIGPPKCSAAEIWKKAVRMGAPGANALAEMGYWADPQKKGRWHFGVEQVFSNWIPDNCAK